MEGGSMPGAFPSGAEEDISTVRTPRRRFVGRRTLEAKQKQDNGGSVEETSAMVQNGELKVEKMVSCLI
jgi:hypothetical protein